MGRESQFKKFKNILFAENQFSKIVITNLGEIDKTQIMLKLAYRTKKKYSKYFIF
jgi:hypothetical protein